jgi:diguanylate cyclase (GGDEF)-like protein
MILALLAILGIANVLLIAANPIRARLERRPKRVASAAAGVAVADAAETVRYEADLPEADRPTPHRGSPDDDAWAAMAIEDFVDQVSPTSGRAAPPPTSAALPPRSPEPPPPSAVPPRRPVAMPSRDDGPRQPASSAADHPPVALKWVPEGLADRVAWDRIIRDESARAARFGRPGTVVMAELHHLDDLEERLGPDVADRVVTETARLLVREGRAADRIAWLGDATFGVLLVETGELQARGYVNRVRSDADRWLESAGLSVRLSLGWASPAENGDLRAAAAAARQRMQDDAHGVSGEEQDEGPRREEVLIRVSRRRSPHPAG